MELKNFYYPGSIVVFGVSDSPEGTWVGIS